MGLQVSLKASPGVSPEDQTFCHEIRFQAGPSTLLSTGASQPLSPLIATSPTLPSISPLSKCIPLKGIHWAEEEQEEEQGIRVPSPTAMLGISA